MTRFIRDGGTPNIPRLRRCLYRWCVRVMGVDRDFSVDHRLYAQLFDFIFRTTRPLWENALWSRDAAELRRLARAMRRCLRRLRREYVRPRRGSCHGDEC